MLGLLFLHFSGQGERTKFDRFVDPNVRGAKYVSMAKPSNMRHAV